MDAPRSADVLVRLASKPEVLEQLKAQPEATLKSLAEQATTQVPRALEQDKWTYRIVISSLGAVALAAALGSIFLATAQIANTPVKIPEVLTALGSAAIGALAGLLAPSPSRG